MFVIFKTGGKQYKTKPGDIVKLELLGDDKGKKVTFNEVLACNHEGKDLIGSPFLKNVEVKGEILENKKGKKVIVFKKRRRHNSRRLNGHRQNISVVKINEITLDGKIIGQNKFSKITKEKKIVKKNISIKKGVENGS